MRHHLVPWLRFRGGVSFGHARASPTVITPVRRTSIFQPPQRGTDEQPAPGRRAAIRVPGDRRRASGAHETAGSSRSIDPAQQPRDVLPRHPMLSGTDRCGPIPPPLAAARPGPLGLFHGFSAGSSCAPAPSSQAERRAAKGGNAVPTTRRVFVDLTVRRASRSRRRPDPCERDSGRHM